MLGNAAAADCDAHDGGGDCVRDSQAGSGSAWRAVETVARRAPPAARWSSV